MLWPVHEGQVFGKNFVHNRKQVGSKQDILKNLANMRKKVIYRYRVVSLRAISYHLAGRIWPVDRQFNIPELLQQWTPMNVNSYNAAIGNDFAVLLRDNARPQTIE